MKYARKDSGNHWIDVQEFPSPFYSDVSDLERKTGVSGYVLVDDGVENGAVINEDGSYENASVDTEPSPPAPDQITLLVSQIQNLTEAVQAAIPAAAVYKVGG